MQALVGITQRPVAGVPVGSLRLLWDADTLDLAIVSEGRSHRVVMTGRTGSHSLDVVATDQKRLLAHMEGYLRTFILRHEVAPILSQYSAMRNRVKRFAKAQTRLSASR